ncbi:hypothetical protein OVA24_15575 [Luteolibacter sp. SL250]|uniref:hypothetical protein n=1 Tax=Luteolibacter sp. SL250 TaxID=2995170 RepID=UPI00226FF10D|nr:hypothetical protein [Luteolibacter sp. SL250]WAC18652.1 hypothetical protein OVA24_15575 [Luteolibacter sp. SL250]
MIRKFLILLGLLTCTAVAQEKFQTTLITYALGGPPGGFKAFFRNGEEIQPFGANGSGLGAPIRYTGSRKFEIRASEEAFAPPPAGQQAPPPLAVVELPQGVDNILLIAADAGQGKIRLLAYDVSAKALKGGDYKIFNFCRTPIEMNLGKKKLTLRPAQNEIMSDSSYQDPTNRGMELIIYRYDGTVRNPTPVKQTLWEHFSTKRWVMFLFDPKHKGEGIGIICMNVEPPRAAPAAAGTAP